MGIKNPFGAGKKLRLETERLEEAERSLSAASTLLRENEQVFQTLLKTEKEVSASARRALVDAEGIAKTQATRIEGLEQELVEAPFRAMEQLTEQRGRRIGYHEFDLIQIQAAARSVDPSIRIERENYRWVFYADELLEQPQMNRLESKIGFNLERG